MTQAFDPAAHKPGMAYKLIRANGDVQIVHDVFDYIASFRHNFTRAPEHDLIPRAVADKLADDVAKLIEDTAQYVGCVCQNGESDAGDCWPCRMFILGSSAEKALAEYQQQTGELG